MTLQRKTNSLMECYRSYRDQIQHEDLLLNQRVTWIVTSQAFLLGTYVFLMNSPTFYMLVSNMDPPRVPGDPHATFDLQAFVGGVTLLKRVFQVVGLSSSIATCISSVAAVLAIRRLMHAYGRHMILLNDREKAEPRFATVRNIPEAQIVATLSRIHEDQGLPPLVTRRLYRVMGLAATAFFGVVFAGAWSVLIFPLRSIIIALAVGLLGFAGTALCKLLIKGDLPASTRWPGLGLRPRPVRSWVRAYMVSPSSQTPSPE